MAITLSHPKTKYNFLRENQREILISFSVLLALLVRLVSPARLAGEWFWINLILFFLFPFLIIRFLLKEKTKDFGLTLGNVRVGIILAAVATFLLTALNYFLMTKPEWRNSFYLYPPIAGNFWIFLWFEIIVAGSVFFAREFFFRGFLQLGLEEKMGNYAIVAQAVLYSLLFLKSPWLIVITAFLSALAAGCIVSKSRSLLYSFSALWLISLATDIMLIRFITSGLS